MLPMDRSDPQMQMLWSPMTHQGQERFARARAAIRARFQHPAVPPVTAASDAKRAPTTISPQALRLRQRLVTAAHRTSDEIFFEAFGPAEALAQTKNEFARLELPRAHQRAILHEQQRPSETTTQHNGEPEPEPTTSEDTEDGSSISSQSSEVAPVRPVAHVSQLARPTRLKTPKRISLKRSRVGESSAEKALPLRKARTTLADTTNLVHVPGGGVGGVGGASSTITALSKLPNPWERHGLGTRGLSTAATVTSSHRPFGTTRLALPTTAFGLSSTTPTATAGAVAVRPATASLIPRPSPVKFRTAVLSTRAFALR